MRLRARAILVIGVTLLGLLGLLYLAANRILLAGFERLEEQDVRTNVQRSLDALAGDISGLRITAGDYAAWDDTYVFAADGNAEYVDANLVEDTFANLRLNIFIIIDSAGQVKYGSGFDLERAVFQPVPAGMQAQLLPGSRLLQHADESDIVSGLLLLPEGAALVASHPILTSDGAGPIGGSLIMGRFLNEPELTRLGQITHLALAMLPLADPASAPPDVQRQLVEAAQSGQPPISVRAIDSELVTGYGLLSDLHGQPQLILRVDLPRSIYGEGRGSVAFFLWSLLVVGLVFGLTNWLLLERFVLSRLERLRQAVRQIGDVADPSLRVPLGGNDELTDVAAAINGMLRAQAASNQALRTSEEQFRKLAETSAAAIFIVQGFRTRYANSRAEALTGYSHAELLARPFSSVLPTDAWGDGQPAQDGQLLSAQDLLAGGGIGIGQQLMRHEVKFFGAGGQARWLDITAGPIEYEGDPAFIATAYDITDRKNAEERIRRHAARAEALMRIGTRLNLDPELDTVLQTICEETARLLSVPIVTVSRYDEKSNSLFLSASFGLSSAMHQRIQAVSQVELAEFNPNIDAVVLTDDVQALTRLPNSAVYAEMNLRTTASVNMLRRGQLVGRLNIGTIGAVRRFTEDELDLLRELAEQAAVAIDNALLFKTIQRANVDLAVAYDATIEGWSRAMDLRDKETEGHSLRVTELTLQMAAAMGLGEGEIVHIRRGALLHDIGKLGVPDAILLKPGPLSDEEWELMRRHPLYAYEMLKPIAYLLPALDIPYCHHEKWDGTGYPRGIKGDEIPLSARIFAVVDVWDALRSDRPYRPGWPEEEVLEHIRSLAGTHIDPKVAELFFQLRSQSVGYRKGETLITR